MMQLFLIEDYGLTDGKDWLHHSQETFDEMERENNLERGIMIIKNFIL